MEERFEFGDMNRLTGITLKRPSGQDVECAVTYTGFDKVRTVRQGNDSVTYTYGFDHQRIRMEEHVGSRTRTKDYAGLCEFVTETDTAGTLSRSLTYLMGPFGVFAVVEQVNGTETTHYVLKDNLGSWTVITDADGIVEQRLSYDAWGNLRNPQQWTNYASGDISGKPMFDRGFTGHEHLTYFGLINMNGRMYDPVMSSFLSVDRFMQNPLSAQELNPYAYCMYNPLRYVDPTGWAPRPGGGQGPDNPLPQYLINGQVSYMLPEITITPYEDRPPTFTEYVYTPYSVGGGGDLPWGVESNDTQTIRPTSGGGGGNHGEGSRNGNTAQITLWEMPPKGTTIHTGNLLFPKTFLRYQIGLLNNIGLISDDFWVDASTILIKEVDLQYRPEYGDYVVNLYNDGDLLQGLALGNLVLNKVGEYEYTIQPDEYDFRIESYRSLKGNIATSCGWIIHNYWFPFFYPKGTYTIRFYGTVTVKH